MQDLVLGDFEDEARPIRRRRPMLAQHPRDRQFDQRRDRHVDRELYGGALHRAVLEVAQRRDDDALGERQHLLLFGAGQEVAGRDDAAVRPPRPQQTLGADQTLGAQLDLRLVPELVPAAQQNLAQRQLAAARLRRGGLRFEQLAQGPQHRNSQNRRRWCAGVFIVTGKLCRMTSDDRVNAAFAVRNMLCRE